jgi:hypothetical protein
MDCVGEIAGRDHHSRTVRGGQERMVPCTRHLAGRTGTVVRQRHRGASRTPGCTRKSPGHTPGPQTHQRTRTGTAAQRPRPGRTRSTAVAVKKSRGDLQQGRGRMILIADRRTLAQDIADARIAGARLEQVCEVAGIDARTLQRWNAQEGLTKGDGRPTSPRPYVRSGVGA